MKSVREGEIMCVFNIQKRERCVSVCVCQRERERDKMPKCKAYLSPPKGKLVLKHV